MQGIRSYTGVPNEGAGVDNPREGTDRFAWWHFDTLCGRWLLRMRGFEVSTGGSSVYSPSEECIVWKRAISVRLVLNPTGDQQNGKHVNVALILRIREKERQSIIAELLIWARNDLLWGHVHFLMCGKGYGKKLSRLTNPSRAVSHNWLESGSEALSIQIAGLCAAL
jgi:hypothetical protein